MSHLYEANKNQYDAFGRLQISNPVTLFDSNHRFRDNGLWATKIVGAGSTFSFNASQGLIDLTVGTGATCKVSRETLKVFSYQPGKGLTIDNTGVMSESKENLTQRIGYFNDENGIFFEQENSNAFIVKRTSVSGITTDIRIPQSEWNIDNLTGIGASNPSGIKLDLSKAEIFWSDIEWLGVGSVRTGFIIDNKIIHAHTFRHANIISSTYMSTACLPIRYEIFNTGITTNTSTLKQICSTVISDGGYELRGTQYTEGTAITSPVTLGAAGSTNSIVSVRLKTTPNRLDAIVILTALSIMGLTNNSNYNWKLISGGTTSSGSWVDAGADSSVEYKIGGGLVVGGKTLASGYFSSSNQNNTTINILRDAIFKYQLERNTFTLTPFELTLAISSSIDSSVVHASIDWEEISR
jgi:hypothetical protein